MNLDLGVVLSSRRLNLASTQITRSLLRVYNDSTGISRILMSYMQWLRTTEHIFLFGRSR